MMAEALDGLFGPTPYDLEQQQRQALMQQANTYAGQSPLERAAGGLYQAGGMLGGMAAKALGGYNPNVKMAEDAQTIQKGIDHTTSEGLLAGAQKLKDVNPALAAKYVQAAQALKTKEAEINLKNAQATKALREPSFRDYEYEKMMEIINDPDSTDEQKKLAQARIDALNAKGKGGIFGAGTVKRMATSIGEVIFDPATKKYTFADGSEVPAEQLRAMVPLGNDPTNAGAVAQAKAGSKTKAEDMAKAQAALPEATNSYNQALSVIDAVEKDPAYKSLIGFSWTPGAKLIPGSKEAGLDAYLQQLSALAEMHQREKLKGTGQITDYESNMARGAIFRASTAQSEEAYRKALADFKFWMGKSMEALHQRADTPFKAPPSAAIASMPQVSAPSNAAPMPQGVAPTTPVAPMPNSGVPAFSGIRTKEDVRTAYQAGKLTKSQANAILSDMKAQGAF